MFTYEIIQEEAKSIVKINGDLDIDVTEIMQDEIAPALMERKDIEIDFSNVPFVDSSGIGLLITLINELREAGSQIAITKVSPDVMHVFSLLQLPEILGHDIFVDLK
ncbi:STAS domain-containing protein [Brevibacillus sp. GCM10020057]|uniref:STAS domain-containing protein n=1 Tax=Brevibacillus sp. GCM10020057 TaxID=3317327 RepID=UPI00363CBE6C